jgi:hypothetical protein
MEPVTALERIVLAHPSRRWNWAALPGNPGIRPEFVISHTDLPWDVEWAIYENPNMTPRWIKEHPDFHMDWNGYSRNPSLTKEFLIENLDKEWNWIRLSSSIAITEDIVEELLDDPRAHWNWGLCGLSKNPNISYEFVEKYIDMPWAFEILSKNNQGLNRCLRYNIDTKEKSQKRMQSRTSRIKKQLMRVTWHPSRYYDWCLDNEEKLELDTES